MTGQISAFVLAILWIWQYFGFTEAFSVQSCSLRSSLATSESRSNRRLASSFYEDFDKQDDDDEDDDEYTDMDDSASIADFRSKMDSIFGVEPTPATDDDDQDTNDPAASSSDGSISSVEELINFARSQGNIGESEDVTDWAQVCKEIQPGTVLVANPRKFCSDMGPQAPNAALLAKYGLTLPPPADLGPDRRADLLPVLIVVEHGRQRGSRAVLLNRRTGYLLGDLASNSDDPNAPSAPPLLEKFCIQPLWFGGVDNPSAGLDMLHICPIVEGARQITADGRTTRPLRKQFDATKVSSNFKRLQDELQIDGRRWLYRPASSRSS